MKEYTFFLNYDENILSEDMKQPDSSESQRLKPKGRVVPWKTCVNCGGIWKFAHYCPAKSEKCGSCGKIGHYTKCCRFSSSHSKENNLEKDDNKLGNRDNDRSPRRQSEEYEETLLEGDDYKENSISKESYDFYEHNHCEDGRKRKHSPTQEENVDNDGREESRYNPRSEANGSGSAHTFIPGTQYESIELTKELAKQCYVQRDYDAALSHYSRLTELCPNDAAIINNKCACYMMLGQYENAFTDAVKVINLDPFSIKGHCRLIKCGILLGNTTSVELSLSKLSLLDPNNEALQFARDRLNELENYLEEEKIAVNDKNYQKALQIAEKCLHISPQSLPFKLKKAEYLALVENYDDSKKLANEIMQKDPGNIEAKYIKGLILYYHRSLKRAVDHFKEILHLAPDHVKSLAVHEKLKLILETVNKRRKAFKSKNYADAHDLCSSALQIDLENNRARKKFYYLMAVSSFNMSHFQQAIDESSEAIEIDSQHIKALKIRGDAHMYLGNYEEAIADFSRICNLKTDTNCQRFLRKAEVHLASVKENSYEILGVHKNASINEIEKAYKDRVKFHHPDRHTSDTVEQKKMHERKCKSITLAYRNLLAKLHSRKKKNADEMYP